MNRVYTVHTLFMYVLMHYTVFNSLFHLMLCTIEALLCNANVQSFFNDDELLNDVE